MLCSLSLHASRHMCCGLSAQRPETVHLAGIAGCDSGRLHAAADNHSDARGVNAVALPDLADAAGAVPIVGPDDLEMVSLLPAHFR